MFATPNSCNGRVQARSSRNAVETGRIPCGRRAKSAQLTPQNMRNRSLPSEMWSFYSAYDGGHFLRGLYFRTRLTCANPAYCPR
jgi:hypothetical protein